MLIEMKGTFPACAISKCSANTAASSALSAVQPFRMSVGFESGSSFKESKGDLSGSTTKVLVTFRAPWDEGIHRVDWGVVVQEYQVFGRKLFGEEFGNSELTNAWKIIQNITHLCHQVSGVSLAKDMNQRLLGSATSILDQTP